jgi:uncharacterized OB-fold protein
MTEVELFRIPGKWEIPYNYSVGRTATKFFLELRDNKRIMGTKCQECNRVLIPPRAFCERCFVELDEWVEVGDKGSLEAFTVVLEPFKGMPEPPYVVAYVKLDGADTSLANFLEGVDLTDPEDAAKTLKIGMPVRVEFQDERVGSVSDLVFRLDTGS